MKLNDEQRAACKKAREAWIDEPLDTSESAMTDAMFAAGIAYERNRCLGACIECINFLPVGDTGLLWEVAENIDYDAARAAQGFPLPLTEVK